MITEKSFAKSYIAIGSNIGDAIANVRQAIEKLAAQYELCASSSLYLTKPWGYLEQPDFINAVVLIKTEQPARRLLEELQNIEKDMGRERVIHWGPRIIDLDILTYNAKKIDEPDLQIPHPHMYERAFVLAPLSEIDSNFLQAYQSLPSELRMQVQHL